MVQSKYSIIIGVNYSDVISDLTIHSRCKGNQIHYTQNSVNLVFARMSQLQSCYVGNFLNDECHKLTYVNKSGLMSIHNDLGDEEKNLLMWRCGLQPIDAVESALTSDACVCFHHHKLYLEKYAFLQKTCCDPLNKHKKANKGSLREIDILLSRKVQMLSGKSVKPGQKMCPRCITEVSKYDDNTQVNKVCEDHDDYNPHDYEREKARQSLNTSFLALECSPLKDSVTRREAKRKLSQGHCALTECMGKYAKVSGSKLMEAPLPCVNCKDFSKIINDLKQQCAVSSAQKQITILTLAPSSWSIKKTAEEFNVTEYKVKRARYLVKRYGILANPAQKKGKQLPESTIKQVVEFYQSDEYSRLCPGKKDYISIKDSETGKRIQVQKRLLLCDVSELYVFFKDQNPKVKVGRSKFYDLRPRWCITAGARGMHNVCVCMTHQNVKLLLSAVPLHMDYKEAMNLIVCDITSKQCMIHRCEDCPGQKAAAEKFLSRIKEELLMDEDDTITFKQWEHSDRSTITTQVLCIEDFVAKLCDQLNILTAHHYTAIAQAAYLKYCKENLDSSTVLILLDFAENYSFVVQDAVQGFHWNNSQATLHPFAIYYQNNTAESEISMISICIISDCLVHDSVTVHCFQQVVIKYIKTILQNVNKVLYYSDGASSQYKNCKNFKNLCMHVNDFGLAAEWNFFATSHGKNVCDGIGGTIKRLATRSSLQHITSGHILTPLDLFQWADKNVKGVKCFYVSSKEVEQSRNQLQNRLQGVTTIPGTRSHHFFLPTTEHDLHISRLSSLEHRAVSVAHVTEAPCITSYDMNPGQYVAVVYDQKWYIGCITQKCEEHQDFLVNFMVPPGPSKSFSWPKHVDECWVPNTHILMCVPAPSTSSTARLYKLSDDILEAIAQSFKEYTSVSC